IQLIKQYVADATAENDAERAVEHKVFYLLLANAGVLVATAMHRHPPGRGKTAEVGNAVPVHINGTYGEGDGVEIGISQPLLVYRQSCCDCRRCRGAVIEELWYSARNE